MLCVVRDRFSGVGGWQYDRVVNSRVLGPPAAWLAWGMDWREVHRMMVSGASCAVGEIVVDIACGGGTSYAQAASEVRGLLIGFDLSPVMLGYAVRRRAACGLEGRVALVRAEAGHLPLPDATATRALLFNALHVIRDHGRVLREARRVVRPGGSLLGVTICADAPLPWRLNVRRLTRSGLFTPPGADELARLGREAGFRCWRQRRSGAALYFEGEA
jgi:SAM-dependent methyltransferase